MAEVILFPDVEDAMRLHLAAAFTATAGFATVTAHAGTKPAILPAEFAHIVRTGGPRSGLVTDAPQVTVEAYARTGARAVAIAGLVRGLLYAAAAEGRMGDITLYGVAEFAGPYSDPDPNAPTHTRYSATYRLAVRGHAA